MRHDGRRPNQLRPIRIKRRFTRSAPGSVLYQAGETIVLCTASVDLSVPAWMAGKGRGWLTAEYSMLPGSTSPRKKRDREKVDGRTTEIQRLIGRSLRAVVNLDALGERTIAIDCDVLQADGGTRTASITAAWIALVDAVNYLGRKKLLAADASAASVITDQLAAISVGICGGAALVDLDYREDVDAEVDMNIVMTGRGSFVELQGTGEEATFTDAQLQQMLAAGRSAIGELCVLQEKTLARDFPKLKRS